MMKRRLMILLVLSVLTIGGYVTIAAAQSEQTEHRITITATDIAFDRNVIEVPVGQPVELTLFNDGALDHDFSIAAIPLDGQAEETTTGQPAAAAMPCGGAATEMSLVCPYADDGAAGQEPLLGGLRRMMSRMTQAMRDLMATWRPGVMGAAGHMDGTGHMDGAGHMDGTGHMMDGSASELQLHIYAAPGSSATVSFVPTEPGEYTFICSVPGHANAGMSGTLTVR